MVKQNKNKSVYVAIAIALTIVGIIAGVNLIKSPLSLEKKAAPSTIVLLTPSFQEVNLGKSFNSIVTVDSDQNKITGIDLEIQFDSSVMKIDSITPTSELVNFKSIIKNEIDNTNGKIRYAAFTVDKSLGVSGKLGLLNIVGSIPSNGTQGNFKLTFADSTMIVATGEGQNVITARSDADIKIIGGVPNFCGGTCGSNSNCQPGYFCYIENGKNDGYCRNPICATNTDCNCSNNQTTAPVATVKPTAKPTVKPIVNATTKATSKASIKPSSTPKVNMEESTNPATDKPTIEFNTLEPNIITTDDLKNNVWSDFSKFIIGIIAFIIIAILIAFGFNRYKKNKTHILPPTNI